MLKVLQGVVSFHLNIAIYDSLRVCLGQIRKVIMRYTRIGYSLNVMQQYAGLIINPVTVDSFAACRWIGR